MHLADAFIQSDLQYIQLRLFFVSMRVPWELNPQPLRYNLQKELLDKLLVKGLKRFESSLRLN